MIAKLIFSHRSNDCFAPSSDLVSPSIIASLVNLAIHPLRNHHHFSFITKTNPSAAKKIFHFLKPHTHQVAACVFGDDRLGKL
jgi:hypothetical protein